MQRVVLLGARGQLGSDLSKLLSTWDLIPLEKEDMDICDYDGIRRLLIRYQPNVVINTAAFHQVDLCEEDVEKAFETNAYAVRNLAQICAEHDWTLMHISTDYVFGGGKSDPFSEIDPPNPLNVYGVSKLAGEYFIRSIHPKHFIVRTSGLYGVAGSMGKGGNFIETMIRLAKEGQVINVVTDQILSPTYTMDLATKLIELLATEQYDLYHITNSGHCSWYEFASKIFEYCDFKPDLHPITSSEYGAKAIRPPFSVLGNDMLQKIGLKPLREWREALLAYLVEKGHIISD
jgi:dTDP-4-dehydrorhamnose reductase